MITCKLSSLMGDRKILKLSEVVHATGINRNTLTSMYYDRAVRIELPVADKLCKYFNCTMNDLFEFKEEVEEKKINLILRLISFSKKKTSQYLV
jgi:putative transcriptional regulator